MKILSWNVAGIRACIKKGGLDFLEDGEYDIVCFQETKATEKQVTVPFPLAELYPFRSWRSTTGITQRKGLSGTSIWSKTEPIQVFDVPDFDTEGRITAVEFENVIVVTVYTPNSQALNSERLLYRRDFWDPQFLAYICGLKEKKHTIVCGDMNVAYDDRDIHKPEKRKNTIGFLESEKEGLRRYFENGFTDGLRVFHQEGGIYTFWDQKIKVFRERNLGWRIDYFLVDNEILSELKACDVHNKYMGSDHCPISCEVEL